MTNVRNVVQTCERCVGRHVYNKCDLAVNVKCSIYGGPHYVTSKECEATTKKKRGKKNQSRKLRYRESIKGQANIQRNYSKRYGETIGRKTLINQIWGAIKWISGVLCIWSDPVDYEGELAITDEEKAHIIVKTLAKVYRNDNFRCSFLTDLPDLVASLAFISSQMLNFKAPDV